MRTTGGGSATRYPAPAPAARARPVEEGERTPKKDLGISRQPLTNREKTQLVDALRSTYGLTELLHEAVLPRSSYFYHRARLDVADKYVDVRRVMADIFECNCRCYG